MEPFGYRVGWLDSANFASRIHRTVDQLNTVCGYALVEKMAKVPSRIRGESRYCHTCFSASPKALEWSVKCRPITKVDRFIYKFLSNPDLYE